MLLISSISNLMDNWLSWPLNLNYATCLLLNNTLESQCVSKWNCILLCPISFIIFRLKNKSSQRETQLKMCSLANLFPLMYLHSLAGCLEYVQNQLDDWLFLECNIVLSILSFHPYDLFRSLFSLLNSTKDYSSIFNHYFHLVHRLSSTLWCHSVCPEMFIRKNQLPDIFQHHSTPPSPCYHLLTLMLKTQPLCSSVESNLRDKSFGCVGKK